MALFRSKQREYADEAMEKDFSGEQEYSSYYKDSLKRFRKNKSAMISAGVLVILVLVAIFAETIAPYSITEQDYTAVLQEPSRAHIMGTDEFGRDIFSRVLYGTRISLSIGIVAQVLASIIGITLGAIAGYYGGVADTIISRVMEIFSAFPDLLFAMAIMTFMGHGVGNLFLALGLLTWVRTARMIRGSVIQLKEMEYIEAATASGASSFWVIMRHLIPNCLSTVIVLVTLGIPNAIMYEASLSYLGLGIQLPTPSWGNMISAAQSYIGYRPTFSIFPGLAIMITVVAFNIFGDGLRDALDPKMRV